MAAITFNTVHQAEHVWERLQTVGESLRKLLDAFVSYRLQLAAAAAEQTCPRRVRDTPLPSMTEQ